MLCLILIVGGPLIMMEQHDRSEALFYYFRMEDQVPDPRQDNLAVKLIELRHQLKERNPNLASGLKVAANSAAFGIFCQMDVKDLDSHLVYMSFPGQRAIRSFRGSWVSHMCRQNG